MLSVNNKFSFKGYDFLFVPRFEGFGSSKSNSLLLFRSKTSCEAFLSPPRKWQLQTLDPSFGSLSSCLNGRYKLLRSLRRLLETNCATCDHGGDLVHIIINKCIENIRTYLPYLPNPALSFEGILRETKKFTGMTFLCVITIGNKTLTNRPLS